MLILFIRYLCNWLKSFCNKKLYLYNDSENREFIPNENYFLYFMLILETLKNSRFKLMTNTFYSIRSVKYDHILDFQTSNCIHEEGWHNDAKDNCFICVNPSDRYF